MPLTTKHKIILLAVFASMLSCRNNEVDKQSSTAKKIKFYYLSHFKNNDRFDTIPYDSAHFINNIKDDSLIYQTGFIYNKTSHTLSMHTNDFKAPVDGGCASYRLDKLGVIYLQSTTWPNYFRLKSNNDSVNSLIETAFDYIILKNKLHYNGYAPPPVKFVPPQTK